MRSMPAGGKGGGRSPPAEADAGEGGERHVRRRPDQIALAQPPPQRPVVVEDVRALVGDERWRTGAGPAAERLVGLVEADPRTVLGTGDARHQAGEPATDYRDVCHVSNSLVTWPLNREILGTFGRFHGSSGRGAGAARRPGAKGRPVGDGGVAARPGALGWADLRLDRAGRW